MKKIFLFFFFSLSLCGMAQIPSDGLVGSWSFNGDAKDVSISQANGAVFGAKLVKDRFGNPNRAYGFDGVNDYIWIGNTVRPSNISVSVWFISNSTNPTMSVIRDRLNAYGFFLNATSSNGDIMPFHNYCFYSNTGVYNHPIQTNCTDSVWHHAVMTYDGYTLKTYIDDKLAASSSGMWSYPVYYPSISNGGLAFGRDGDSDGHYFKGALDDIKIYNRALNKSEVDALYNDSPCSYVYYDTIRVSVVDTLIIKSALLTTMNSTKISEIKVYPNPTKDKVLIKINDFEGLQDCSISIINSSAQVVFQNNLTQNDFQIDLSKFGSEGIYFLQIIDKNKKIVDVKKIVLQK